MAITRLATSLPDLKARLERIVVGYTRGGDPVSAADLKAAGSMAAILRDAVKPNLLQTLEHTPVLVHAGPFGNIAHGNSSILADLIGIHGGDFLVTEAGFGADMGAERFFNIKCRASGLVPDAAVVVATVRALKAHSGKYAIVAGRALPEDLFAENPDDVLAGAANLRKQIDNIRLHGVPAVVAINAFPGDHPSEHRAIEEVARDAGARVAVCTHFADGGRGAAELAEAVAEAAENRASSGSPTRTRRTCGRRSRPSPPGVRRGDGVDYHTTRPRGSWTPTSAPGSATAAVVHRQTHLSILVRPDAEGCADRLAHGGAGGARLGGRGLHLPAVRGDAHDARPGHQGRHVQRRAGRRRLDHRPLLTALTTRATPSTQGGPPVSTRSTATTTAQKVRPVTTVRISGYLGGTRIRTGIAHSRQTRRSVPRKTRRAIRAARVSATARSTPPPVRPRRGTQRQGPLHRTCRGQRGRRPGP
jgi:hypothetical protein